MSLENALEITLEQSLETGLEQKYSGSTPTPRPSPWILETGRWNDDGIWVDTETWRDTP